MMKRLIFSGLMTVLIALSLAGCTKAEKPTLKVYNAGEYIDTSLLKAFEREYGCSVTYTTFDSNETMYSKVSAGGDYDVVIPSDYMIEKFIEEGMLAEIDWDLIPNADGLMDEVKNQAYDPDMTYSVPYFWGTVGILYDTTVVDKADLAQGWHLLCDTTYAGDLYMYDSQRDSFMIALKALGYSMNTTDETEITEAYNWLVAQRDTMDPVYIGDDVIANMIAGEKSLAVVYSGDAVYIMSENENLGYYTPEEGTNVWYDAMVILKSSTEKELAHAFINFMLDPDHALSNTQEVGYTTTIQSVFDTVRANDYADVDAYVPDLSSGYNEVFCNQDTNTKALFSALWVKVKAYMNAILLGGVRIY